MNKVKRLSPKAYEALSAYIDGQLRAEEALAIEAQLAHSIELKQAHDRIKAMRASVRALPKRKAPRNFILTRAEAAEAKRGRNWTRAFGFAFSVCMVFLVALFGYGGIQNGMFMAKEAPPMAEAPMAESLMADVAIEALQAEPEMARLDSRNTGASEPTPALITWGSPYGKGGGGPGSSFDHSAPRETKEGMASSMRVESSSADGKPIEKEHPTIKAFIIPPSTSGMLCGEQFDCGFSNPQSELPKDQDGNQIDNPAQYVREYKSSEVFVNNQTGEVTICDPINGCGLGDGSVENEEPEQKIEAADASPLILGMNTESPGEVLSASPKTLQKGAEESIQPMMVEAEEADAEMVQASPYEYDIDHQNFLRDQLILWLKIGLASIGIIFGVLWLILRRR